ncbi:MAG: NUDIX hydrolase [Verrucomicrobia bacterium]|nr:NUDIX hydrolase [Verrucomicrobiota bacterium]
MREHTLQTQEAFRGRLLSVDVLDVELSDGTRSQREIIRHRGAAVIVAQLDDDRFVFVRQFRKAIETDLLEVVAGTLDAGEDPTACAHRELLEETGYTARQLHPLGVMYPAPGYTDERLYTFHAWLNPVRGAQRPDTDERLAVEILQRHEIEDLIATGRLNDAKSLGAWQLFTAAASAIGRPS